MTPEQQAEIERIRRAYARFPGATVQTSAAVIVAALDEAQAEADAKRVALTASDERLILAGLRVDLYFGCDTAQHLADEIVNLRVDLRHAQAEAERLRAENARLRDIAMQAGAEIDILRKSLQAEAELGARAVKEALEARDENARLREALGQYADHDNWGGHPLDYRSDTITYDIWQGGEDVHGWETAERALATNETPTA